MRALRCGRSGLGTRRTAIHANYLDTNAVTVPHGGSGACFAQTYGQAKAGFTHAVRQTRCAMGGQRTHYRLQPPGDSPWRARLDGRPSSRHEREGARRSRPSSRPRLGGVQSRIS